jgi:FeS assembly SUF system regulator
MSKLTDYGIVLMANLARSPEASVHNAQELAEASRVPLPTVSKLLKGLSKAGLVVSHRGRRGGYSLSRRPARISVAEIIAALEGPIGLTECSDLGAVGACDLESVCLARGSWGPISQAIKDALEGLSLDSLGVPAPKQPEQPLTQLGPPPSKSKSPAPRAVIPGVVP